jgi:hypothetical protein
MVGDGLLEAALVFTITSHSEGIWRCNKTGTGYYDTSVTSLYLNRVKWKKGTESEG